MVSAINFAREEPITVDEAAEWLKCSTRTVWSRIKEGKLEAGKFGRQVRTSKEAIGRAITPVNPGCPAEHRISSDAAAARELEERWGIK